jgi:hypothetical protein
MSQSFRHAEAASKGAWWAGGNRLDLRGSSAKAIRDGRGGVTFDRSFDAPPSRKSQLYFREGVVVRGIALIAAGLAATIIAMVPGHVRAGSSGASSANAAGCSSGLLQVVLENRSKWQLTLSTTPDSSQSLPQTIDAGSDGFWCSTAADTTGSVAYTVNANSGSIISYTLAAGTVSNLTVLPEGGPPTAYCIAYMGTYERRQALILTYTDSKPDSSSVQGVCAYPAAGTTRAPGRTAG